MRVSLRDSLILDDKMTEKDDADLLNNVVSLESMRARRKGLDSQEPTKAHDDPRPTAESALEPIPGILTWLRCPTCESLEYTEIEMKGGRRHKCGTIVDEAEVALDVRAEYTLTKINLERIDLLAEYLDSQRRLFQEYERRLEIIAGEVPEPYALTGDPMKTLLVKNVDPLGLLISAALHDPASRFKDDDDG